MDLRNRRRRSADAGIVAMLSGWRRSVRMAFVASSAGGRERRWVPSGVRNKADALPADANRRSGRRRDRRRPRSSALNGELTGGASLPYRTKPGHVWQRGLPGRQYRWRTIGQRVDRGRWTDPWSTDPWSTDPWGTDPWSTDPWSELQLLPTRWRTSNDTSLGRRGRCSIGGIVERHGPGFSTRRHRRPCYSDFATVADDLLTPPAKRAARWSPA